MIHNIEVSWIIYDAIGLCYSQQFYSFQLSFWEITFFQFGLASGSKYYNTQEHQPLLLLRRSNSKAQIKAVANTDHFIIVFDNKTPRHSSQIHTKLIRKWTDFNTLLAVHVHNIVLSSVIWYDWKCSLGVSWPHSLHFLCTQERGIEVSCLLKPWKCSNCQSHPMVYMKINVAFTSWTLDTQNSTL